MDEGEWIDQVGGQRVNVCGKNMSRMWSRFAKQGIE